MYRRKLKEFRGYSVFDYLSSSLKIMGWHIVKTRDLEKRDGTPIVAFFMEKIPAYKDGESEEGIKDFIKDLFEDNIKFKKSHLSYAPEVEYLVAYIPEDYLRVEPDYIEYNESKHNRKSRLQEEVGFYEFSKLSNFLDDLGWGIIDSVSLTKHGKKYEGIVIRNDNHKSSSNYTPEEKVKDLINNYFEGKAEFSYRNYKYAPESKSLVVAVPESYFNGEDDQLEFDFNESFTRLKAYKDRKRMTEDIDKGHLIKSVKLKDGTIVDLCIWCDNFEALKKATYYVKHQYGEKNVYLFYTLHNMRKEGRKACSDKTGECYTIKRNANNL